MVAKDAVILVAKTSLYVALHCNICINIGGLTPVQQCDFDLLINEESSSLVTFNTISIHMMSNSGAKKNKKTTFTDEDEDFVDQNNGDNTGDALDSFQLSLEEEEEDGQDEKQSISKTSSRTGTKRIRF
ncbi:unnamed protein product [Peronospora farinosa]|uniref:Nucleoplasmin-like domain-containing protein n=1 Tax=Peronospora farinosa TaxID=134698 RepID=A0AAV0UID9_9STRA|nr:unnamed protein product [Peronospora farinosa]CAI5736771.1 unnamed protein product [Peronospora farinosa]